MSSAKLNFKHIIFISTVTKRSQGLARVLQGHLNEPKFSYLNPAEDALPDRLFNWWDVDLMMIDLSKDKASIYKWYSDIGRRDFMPPVIFLAHPASYSDAGSFYRAGASNYLEFKGIKKANLIRSLMIAEKSIAEPQQAAHESTPPEAEDESDNSFSLKAILSGEKSSQEATTDSEDSSSSEPRADFLNTGILNILDRDKLTKKLAKKNR